MGKADLFCLKCRRHQRVKKSREYRMPGVAVAFAGRCPECGAWLFKMVKLGKTA